MALRCLLRFWGRGFTAGWKCGEGDNGGRRALGWRGATRQVVETWRPSTVDGLESVSYAFNGEY